MALNRVLPGLKNKTLLTGKTKFNSDVDLSFTAKPGTPTSYDSSGVGQDFKGDIYKKTDAGAVRQAVKNIIQTNFGEKPFNPYFGGDIRSMLFETRDQESIYLLETSLELQLENNIRNSISTYEPRAELLNVEINAGFNNNTLAAIITFKIKSTEEVVTLETNLSRIK